jgi:SAM-dependent methyltransferase
MLVRDYFDATVDTWEAIYQRRTVYAAIYRQRLRAALQRIDDLTLGPGRTALDIGCGPGFATTHLARRGLFVDAIDASARMVGLTLARARSEGLDRHVRGTISDIRALSFADAAFDVVLAVGVSEWLASLEQPLAEVARVLKPGGYLVFTADNGWALSCLLDPLQHPLVVPLKRALGGALHRLWPARRPLRTYARSSSTLKSALRRAGLTPTSASTLGFGPFTFLNRSLLPDAVGQALDRRLEALAGHASPLRGAGLVHILVARNQAVCAPSLR